MRASQLLIPTLKETPADADIPSHRFMLRAGLIRRLAAGIYTWLPLGLRVLRKVEAIIREEMNRSGAQEVLMPFVQPAELWQESNRWEKMGPEMLRLQDRHQRDFCLGPTHEEVITDIVRREVQSYKQLPCNLYQINLKFRDEIRPRFGVMRAREFLMKDGYSFHLDEASFDATYAEMHACYGRILSRMQLDFRAVLADTGNIGGSTSHEFQVLASSGEDRIAFSDASDYAANVEKAEALAPPSSAKSDGKAREGRDARPAHDRADRRSSSKCRAAQTLKTLIVAGTDGPVALVLRGDHELNEIKAQKLPGVASPLTFATDAAIRAQRRVRRRLARADRIVAADVRRSQRPGRGRFHLRRERRRLSLSRRELGTRRDRRGRSRRRSAQRRRRRSVARRQRTSVDHARHRSGPHLPTRPQIQRIARTRRCSTRTERPRR